MLSKEGKRNCRPFSELKNYFLKKILKEVWNSENEKHIFAPRFKNNVL